MAHLRSYRPDTNEGANMKYGKFRLLSAVATTGLILGHTGVAHAQGPAQAAPATSSDSVEPSTRATRPPETESQDGAVGPDNSGVSDIVVTAQKRSESSQRVPVSITAVSGADLSARGYVDTRSLVKAVPGLNVTMTAGYNGGLNFNLRGVGQNTFSGVQEAGIATYQDEFYLASSQGSVFATFDNDRVEVLRGPQGTLYGRSASGGLINFINKRPGTGYDGFVTLGVGTYGGKLVEAAQDVALDEAGDNALRASVRFNGSDGFMHSQTGGKNLEGGDQYAGRLQLRLKPASNLTILLKGEYGKVLSDHSVGFKHINAYADGKGDVLLIGPTQNVFGTPGADIYGYRDTSSDFWSTSATPGYTRTVRQLYTGRADWDFGGMTLTSLTGYLDIKGRYIEDTDGTSANELTYDSHGHNREFTQELRLSSDPAAAIKWTLGAFYFNYKVDQDGALSGPGVFPFGLTDPFSARNFVSQKRHSFAGFAQIELPLGEKLSLTAGGRVEREHAEIRENQVFTPVAGTAALFGPPGTFTPELNGDFARIDKTYVSGGATLTYKVDHDILLYASLKRGIKPGGFSTPDTFLPPAQMSFKEEKLDALEGGIKSSLLDRTLRLNLSAYHYWYNDYQAVQYALVTYTGNATARVTGVDVEIVWAPVRSFEAGISGGYVRAVAKDIPYRSGGVIQYRDRDFPNAPRLPINAYVRYRTDLAGGDLTFRLDEIYRSKTYYEIQNKSALTQEAYALTDATIGWSKDDWSITANVSNLFNKKYLAFGQDASDFGFIAGTLGRPRMFMLQVNKRW